MRTHFKHGVVEYLTRIGKTLKHESTKINLFYCLKLVLVNEIYLQNLVTKSMKFIPLWSKVIIPIFGYREDIWSSAAVINYYNN